MVGEKDFDSVSRVFDALGNPVRLRILAMVKQTTRPLHIKAISTALKLDYGVTYRHVEMLKDAGLLEIFEVGRSRVLSLYNPQVVGDFLELAGKIGKA